MSNPILYNVTVLVDNSVEQEWVKWMKEIHIPDVMKTNYFLEYKFSKVMADQGSEGQSYAIQYLLESMEKFNEYNTLKAPALKQEHIDKYGEKCLAFRTLLEVIDHK